MAFPYELLQYAENFYRRFPEEFIALGAPGLEEVYDLRPNSTLSRRIQDTQSEKSVEITIRRWQTPSMPMGGAMPPYAGYHQAQSFGPPPHLAHYSALGALQHQAANTGHYGHPSYNGYPGVPAAAPAMAMQQAPAPAQSAPRWEAELNSRLARLEGALSSLAPQIEVLLIPNTQQPQPQQQQLQQPRQQQQQPRQEQVNYAQFTPPVPQQNIMPRTSSTASLKLPGSSDDATAMRQPAANAQALSPSKGGSLASRRGVGGSLAIETSPKAAPRAVDTAGAPQAAKPIAVQPQPIVTQRREVPEVQSVPSNGASPKNGDKVRPTVSINPVRMASGFADPQSPRSPGRFSAWK